MLRIGPLRASWWLVSLMAAAGLLGSLILESGLPIVVRGALAFACIVSISQVIGFLSRRYESGGWGPREETQQEAPPDKDNDPFGPGASPPSG